MIDVSKAFAIYGKRLRHFILSRVRREDDADDILQDVFMRLIVNSRETTSHTCRHGSIARLATG